MTDYPADPPTRAGRRRRRPLVIVLIVLVVLAGLLVAADFAARAVAENRVAAEIQSHGFPKRPEVSIAGFPFLTQLIGRDFGQVNISSDNVPEGTVTITSIKAVLTGVRVNSGFNGGTITRLTGSALITFPQLASALAARAGALGAALGGAGLTLSQAGRDAVRTTVTVLGIGGSATWQLTGLSSSGIEARLVAISGLLAGLRSSLADITVPLPALPLGLRIASVRVTPAGVVGTLYGRNVAFGS